MSYVDRPRTADEYFVLLEQFCGQTIERVSYRDLCYDGENSKAVYWDRGGLHQPTMGVELRIDGQSLSFIWGQTGPHFSLQVFAGDLTETVRHTAQSWDVSDHHAWQPFTNRPIQNFALWIDTVSNLVTAIELSTDKLQTVWIVIADTDTNDRPLIGMDDLVVIFDETIATQSFDASLVRVGNP
jgi:hypothetical protein